MQINDTFYSLIKGSHLKDIVHSTEVAFTRPLVAKQFANTRMPIGEKIPVLGVIVGGAGLKRMKEVTLEVSYLAREVALKYNYLIVRARREVHIDLLSYVVQGECVWYRGSSRPLQCSEEYFTPISLISWHSGIKTVE